MTHTTCNPVQASFYADESTFCRAKILENIKIAENTYRVRIEASHLAAEAIPGQFVMIRVADCIDPLLGRPFAIFDILSEDSGQPGAMDIVYLVQGKMTSLLAKLVPGRELELWGPLGNGFSTEPTEHLIMVAGGIGQTPFLTLGAEALGKRKFGKTTDAASRKILPAEKVVLCYGARSKNYLAGVEAFEQAGFEVRISTDDGSAGHHGLVTKLLTDALKEAATAKKKARVVTCGPEPMLKVVAEICESRNIACEVSLETPMACGLGICFSCVTKVLQEDGTWDYKRTCVEGPVFQANKLVWD